MAIYRILEGMAFNDRAVKAMTDAYEALLIDLGLTDRTDPITHVVARKIVTLCQVDGCDLSTLREQVLKDLRG